MNDDDRAIRGQPKQTGDEVIKSDLRLWGLDRDHEAWITAIRKTRLTHILSLSK